jgi:UDPglucose--hexose-1-phosphate uridylyltransferase
MSELRYNPLLDTYTIVAANRQNRPNFPENWCAFCPGEGKKVPEKYDVFLYPNDFPALDYKNKHTDTQEDTVYHYQMATGACEVILYTSEHEAQIYNLSDEHVFKLINLWVERFEYHQQFDVVKYIFPFENRGNDVGVTMPHPHGQLYAYPFIPLKIKTELDNCRMYFGEKHVNMFDDILFEETTFKERIIFETETFSIFLPYFTDYPYGIFIVSKKDKLFINDFDDNERMELGMVLKKVVKMFDNLFDCTFPFMMCVHQGVVNSTEYTKEEQREFYRFHIEFYPPWRAKNVIKYYASSETGAWAATNTRSVEETAKELRTALEKE